MKTPLLARAILFGFLFLFAFAAAYLLLDSLGVWGMLPTGVTHGAEILSGLILLGTLLGHLILASGRLPLEAAGSPRPPGARAAEGAASSPRRRGLKAPWRRRQRPAEGNRTTP